MVGKHFPGHGFVAADSHTDVPVDKRSLTAILADDAAPYAWLGTTLSSVMPRSRIIARISFIPQLSYLGLDCAPLYPAGFHLPAGDPLTVLLDFQRLHR